MPSASSAAPARPPAASADPLPCQRGGSELWFSELPAELEQAKAHCQHCPLRTACLAGALERAARIACAEVPSRPHGAGALSSPARCRGVVKLDRRQSEARSEEFIKAWVAGRLPDDPGGFRVCGEVVT